MARARRPLVIVTHGDDWNNRTELLDYFTIMNEAVEKNLVTKIQEK